MKTIVPLTRENAARIGEYARLAGWTQAELVNIALVPLHQEFDSLRRLV